MSKRKVPKGLKKCEVCGEWKGKTKQAEILCVCAGPLCVTCNEKRIHRPISNYWDEDTGRAIHVPWFVGFELQCDSCKAEYVQDYTI